MRMEWMSWRAKPLGDAQSIVADECLWGYAM
jgi:hypothetical protein